MSDLHPPDAQFLLAAIGWIELGLPAEATTELKRISAACSQHPDVMEVRWQICAATADWNQALTHAEALVALAPDRESGWIHRAYSLRRAPRGGLSQAWEALHPAAEKFPQSPIILYNLACYAAQFGRLTEAMEWLAKALRVAEEPVAVKQMALADDDLKSVWEAIRKL